ncbi:MAG: hypothetical protein U9N12_06590 [Euryarchaeota archaeon]|nr:hypothetical protein [Euryarchaeota archaeon]
MTIIKNVQIELPQELYNEFRTIVEADGKTIKTAVIEAINEWKMRHAAFNTADPLFNFSNVIESGGDAATVDEITYSGEATN